MPFKPVFYKPVERWMDTSTNVWHSVFQAKNEVDFLSDASTQELRLKLLAIPEIRQLIRGIGLAKLGAVGQHVADDAGYGAFTQVMVQDQNGVMIERGAEMGVIPENRMNMLRIDTPASGSCLMNAGRLADVYRAAANEAEADGVVTQQVLAAIRAQQDAWDRSGGA